MWIQDWQIAMRSGNGMIHHGKRQIRAAHRPARAFDAGEGLRTDIMHNVTIDVDQRRKFRIIMNNMFVPNFVVQSSCCHSGALSNQRKS